MRNRPILICDTECYRNYWLVKFYDPNLPGVSCCKYEQHDHKALQCGHVRDLLLKYTLITFNGINYDIPMITYALAGASCESLKHASDLIINGMKWWEFYDHFNLEKLGYLDHIDIKEVLPGVGVSLKLYAGRFNSRMLQDLPIDPNVTLTQAQIQQIDQYNTNDLVITYDAYLRAKPAIDLRIEMSKKFGVDLRSKSDAQMAEAIIKSQLNFKPVIPVWSYKIPFKYDPPPFIQFEKNSYLDHIFTTIKKATFYVSDKDQLDSELDENGKKIKTGIIIPEEIKKLNITINNRRYKLAIGGLHSTEKSIHFASSKHYSICDVDVASYYPSLILLCQITPKQLGIQFLNIYKSIYEARLFAKKSNDPNKKIENEGLKIVLNGTFGKFGSKYSILFAPDLLIKVTLTGQLCLLMLIDLLERYNIPVISANTDGIVMLCPLGHETTRDQVIQYWESLTGLKMEYTDYSAIYSRDVNNYIAFKTDGKIKTKGIFSSSGITKNPQNYIAVRAVINYLQNNIPLMNTVRGSTDINEFITVRTVKGGATCVHHTPLPPHESKEKLLKLCDFELVKIDKVKRWICPITNEQYTTSEAYLTACERLQYSNISQSVGKVIRYYYAKDEHSHIAYATNRNKVPSSEGAKLLMTLSDIFPNDIDYEKYEQIAIDLLKELGVNYEQK